MDKKVKPHSSKNKIEERDNIQNRNFTTTDINEKWVTDIIYIYTIQNSWCYLASVMDLCSKKIIGFAFSKTMDTDITIKAVSNAIREQKPNKAILHSDLGSQYTSKKFKEFLSKSNIIHSFS